MRSLLLLIFIPFSGFAQIGEMINSAQVRTVQLYAMGDPLSFPALQLNSGDRMELHFDDMDGDVKSYYYTYQLCNADWTPSMLLPFDYIGGFIQQRISTYRTSSLALTRYTHYQALLPDGNSRPKVSGNYILKVYLDGDTSKLVFTRRFLVFENRTIIAAQVLQPYNAQFFRTHQKVEFKVNAQGLQVVNAGQQTSVTILQNGRWDNAAQQLHPIFMTNNVFTYDTERDAVFSAGKEWRWLDLRSFRLQSDRVDSAHYYKNSTEIFVRPNYSRRSQQFNFYRDHNGRFYLETLENYNPLWQGDYAMVHFYYVPAGNVPFSNKDLYLFGQLSDYGHLPEAKMKWNAEKGIYETILMLKQGYFDLAYATLEQEGAKQFFSVEDTEGNYWETENEYMILVYYRPLGGRYDQLVGLTKINSLTGRAGVN